MMIAACLAPADEDLLFCTPSQILNPKVKGLIQPAQSGQIWTGMPRTTSLLLGRKKIFSTEKLRTCRFCRPSFDV
jgi:hypothetical protein